MDNPFIGQVLAAGFNFAPKGWAFCNGQILPIRQNTALFSLIGTTYGGDGKTTFALPDLQGRVALHTGGNGRSGQGPGLSPYDLGEQVGVENETLTLQEMAAHTHDAVAFPLRGSTTTPAGADWARSATGDTPYSSGNPTGFMSAQAVRTAGGGQPHENRQPFLVVNFIIALVGIFPSRP